MKKFMRTRSAAPQPPPLPPPRDAHKPNGHANGAAPHDQHSTLSRYWSGSEGSGAAGAGAPLWEDEEFPPGAAALGERRAPRDLVWLRPHELVARPRFLGDDEAEAPPAPESDQQRAARWSVCAGPAALPALARAAAALAHVPRLLARVVPPQSFRTGYVGAFRFQFWVFGEWREVLVDDRLPARAPRSPLAPRALGARCALLPDDFTLPLLEKAYAKLYGSYAAARAAGGAGAQGAAALQELTGGVVQSFAPPRQPRALLLQVLHSAVPRSTLLLATAVDAAPEKEGAGRRLRCGLVAGLAYLVTGLASVREPGDAEEAPGGGALVRLRATAGAGARAEWAGRWARDGPAWRALPPADRDLLARGAPEPGHFWMSFADFARSFARLELVHVGPDDWLSEPALRDKRPWRAVLARRRWRAGYNAGGPPGAAAAHANPQFHLSVPRAAAGRCHVVVSVTQQYAPRPRRAAPPLSVGFALYELPAGTAPRRAALAPRLADLRALDVTHASRAREVATFFTLPAGQYLLVPHSRAHSDGAFLLRVLTDHHTDLWEVNDDNVIIRDIAAEVSADPAALPPELQAAAARLLRKLRNDEMDAAALRAALRGRCGAGGASLELCRALVALRDPGAAGRVPARAAPALLALLAAWRAAWAAAPRPVSAYDLRALLWACGLTASNKVLECVVVRFARGAALHLDAFLLALARLHLAHGRYRSLEAKLKSNPLSLEEVILMTVYS